MSIQVWLGFLPCLPVIATSITSKIWARITTGTRAFLPISCRCRNHKSLMAHSSMHSVTSRTLGLRRVLRLSLVARHLEASRGLILSSLALEASRDLITSNMAIRRLQTSRDFISIVGDQIKIPVIGVDLITSKVLRGNRNLILPPRDLATRINRFSQVLTRHPGFHSRALALNLALIHI